MAAYKQAIERLKSQWLDTFAAGVAAENDNISKRNIMAQNFLRENGPYILRAEGL